MMVYNIHVYVYLSLQFEVYPQKPKKDVNDVLVHKSTHKNTCSKIWTFFIPPWKIWGGGRGSILFLSCHSIILSESITLLITFEQ